MITYYNQDQGLTIQLPEDGEVFKNIDGTGAYKRVGNKIIALDNRMLGGGLGDFNNSNIPNESRYYIADLERYMRKTGLGWGGFEETRDINQFVPTPVTKTNEVFTQTTRPDNPNSAVITSNQKGVIQPGVSIAEANSAPGTTYSEASTDPNRIINFTTGQTAAQMNDPSYQNPYQNNFNNGGNVDTAQGDNTAQYNTPQQDPISGGSPYFMGDQTLVRFAGGANNDTYWLVDNTNKTLRPFSSMKALEAAYGPNLQSVLQNVKVINSPTFGANGLIGDGVFNGFSLLSPEYAITDTGAAKQLDYSPSQLVSRYGQAINENGEKMSVQALDGLFNNMTTGANQTGIPSEYLTQLKGDKQLMAYYVSAMTYGGYSMSDVYADIKRRNLLSKGDTSYQNILPISASQNKSQYGTTDAGRAAATNVNLQPPAQIGKLDSGILKLPVFQIPADAFKVLVPYLTPGTPEFDAAMSKIETSYYDILEQQMKAKTEQEQSLAQYNWEKLKGYMESSLGVSLSNNALDAWDQVQGLKNQFAAQGIEGSGLQNESIDNYLTRVRSTDAENRKNTAIKGDETQQSYYTQFATPQQIKDFAIANPALAKAWGLTPSDEIASQMSVAALKAKYPQLSDQQIAQYRANILDENGNYRSGLYQKYMGGNNMGVSAANVSYDSYGNPTVTPGDSGVYDIRNAAKTYQEEMAYQLGRIKEEQAYREYTTPDSPFIGVTPNTNTGAGATLNPFPIQYSPTGSTPPPPNSTTSSSTPVIPTAPKPTTPTQTTNSAYAGINWDFLKSLPGVDPKLVASVQAGAQGQYSAPTSYKAPTSYTAPKPVSTTTSTPLTTKPSTKGGFISGPNTTTTLKSVSSVIPSFTLPKISDLNLGGTTKKKKTTGMFTI